MWSDSRQAVQLQGHWQAWPLHRSQLPQLLKEKVPMGFRVRRVRCHDAKQVRLNVLQEPAEEDGAAVHWPAALLRLQDCTGCGSAGLAADALLPAVCGVNGEPGECSGAHWWWWRADKNQLQLCESLMLLHFVDLDVVHFVMLNLWRWSFFFFSLMLIDCLFVELNANHYISRWNSLKYSFKEGKF